MSTLEVVDSGKPGDRGRSGERALEYMRELLATGRLGSGDRVNEAEIASALGISRGPVREAVRRLTSSGLLVAEPNLGSRVLTLDVVAVQALYEVRESLEALSARLAAERMSTAERHALTDMLDEHEAAMRDQGSSSYPTGSADWDFHLAVLAGSRNEIAGRICGSDLRDHFSLLRARHGRREGRGWRALQEHRWVGDAIVQGQADLAGMLMAQHIRASRDNLLSLMRAASDQPRRAERG